MWQYVIGGATVFGLIVGLFSVYTGRATRNYSGALIKEEGRRAQELIERHEEKTPELIDKHGARTQDLLERQGKILVRLVEQHTTLISMLKTYRTEGG